MDFKNPSVQMAIKNAVFKSWQRTSQGLFTNKYAEACVELNLNMSLPEGIDPIPLWTEESYSIETKKFFRRLGLKDDKPMNVDVVAATYNALLYAMPEDIRIALINSQHEGLGVVCVSDVKAKKDNDMDELISSAVKEVGEALSSIGSKDKPRIIKECLEAVEALKNLVEVTK